MSAAEQTTNAKRHVSVAEIVQQAADPAAFAAACEAAYQARLDALTEEILTGGRHIVMLTGGSAAGKTTSAHRLAKAVAARGRRSAVLSLDDFYIGEGRYPKRPDGTDDYECLQALDLAVLHDCLRSLNETGRCVAPVFDFKKQLPAGTQQVDCRDGVVIIEGLHALNPAIVAPLPHDAVLRVYATLGEEYEIAGSNVCLKAGDVRLTRRLVRDYRTRNHSAAFTLGLWQHVCEGEQRYIAPYKADADKVLDTSHRYEVCLWRQQLAALPMGDAATASALRRLRSALQGFPSIDPAMVPPTSMLQEFLG